jgi:hypothetical protein
MADDSWVCEYCGSDEIDEKAWVDSNTLEFTYAIDDTDYFCHSCCEEVKPMSYFKWTEKIAEETMGNKEEYHKILDGSRM